ncbi:MAG: 3-phosphoserine/phosphohydroxythreonine transaminase [Erysipelotrichaceae bacterium]|nr:3-phosphoserine/phosphohydroxythreonine transaminase [Erysipelotrichaceae bacterium]
MTDKRVYNFSAGPSQLPMPVLEAARDQMLNYNGSGQSVMEMSHRSAVYQQIFDETKADLKELLNIPDNYKILLLHGGATQQFGTVALNLLHKGRADYIVTGQFSGKAAQEASKFGDVHIAYSGKEGGFKHIPSQDELDIRDDIDYVHLCNNNTIYGTEWNYVPDTKGAPLVVDMSSDILSRPVDVSKYGVIYAGAQKNMGIAGLGVIIIREDLITPHKENIQVLSEYDTMVKSDSMYNTPPAYAIYVLGLMLKWLKSMGGLEEMQKRSVAKAKLLYDYLDNQDFYIPHAEPAARSNMNVTFTTPNKDLDAKFVKESIEAGMVNLKGHRSVGGIRASIYNAMPIEGVEYLVDFMKKFAEENK